MTDQTSSEDPGTPDITPTEAIESIELADHQPVAAQPTPAPAEPKQGGNHTRLILEIVGAAAAVVLIAGAAVGGFVAGLAVGDEGPGERTIEHMAQEWEQGEMGPGQMGEGIGPRHEMGEDFGPRHEMGEDFEMGPGQMGRDFEMGPGQMGRDFQ